MDDYTHEYKEFCSRCKRKDLPMVNYSTNTFKRTKRVVHYMMCSECNTNRAKAYRNTDTGKENIYKAIKKYESNNTHKRKAWGKVQGSKLNKEPCEVCGKKKVEAHHDDYSKPLEVRWLCRVCHNAWHKENPS